MSVLLVAASEPSKVPFFILGGLLVVWAAIGLSRPEFPNSAGGQRGVIAVSLVLIVLAIGAAIATA
jgi:hypothetical protein